MVTILICQSISREIDNALMDHFFSRYSISEHMIMDQDHAFMSTLINDLFKKLGNSITL